MQNLKTILHSNIFFFGFLFVVICLCFFYYRTPKVSQYALETTELEGEIISFKIDGNFLSMEVNALEKIEVFYYFKTLEEKEYYDHYLMSGMKIKLSGSMQVPNKASLPNTFDYHNYLYYQNI